MLEAVYDAKETGNFEIYTLVSGAPKQITKNTVYDSWWPRLNPDGVRILFNRTPAGVHDTDYSQVSVWMVNVDGSNLHEIIPRNVWGSAQGHSWWLPNGRQFVHWTSTLGICVFRDNATLLKRGLDNNGADPVYGPDGRIYYIKPEDGSSFLTADPQSYRIWRMRSDGTNKKRLINLPHRMNDPCVSRDGKKIAWEANYSNSDPGKWDIWIANIDGTDPHVLYSDGLVNTNPVFGIDGLVWFYKTKFFVNGFAVHSISQGGTGLTHRTPWQTTDTEMVYPV